MFCIISVPVLFISSKFFSNFSKNNYTIIAITNLLMYVIKSLTVCTFHKIMERKVKTLTRNWRDHWRIGTQKHTETVSRYFDRHDRLYQTEESKYLWTCDKDGITREFMKSAIRGLQEGWMERNYLRLMPGLSLEDRPNW